MKITINQELQQLLPEFSVIAYTMDVENNKTEVVQQLLENLDVPFSINEVTSNWKIKETRDGYKKLKKDPSHTRCAVEALVRRVIKHRTNEASLYTLGDLIDLGNIDRFDNLKEYVAYVSSLSPEVKIEEARKLSLKFKSFKDNKVIEDLQYMIESTFRAINTIENNGDELLEYMINNNIRTILDVGGQDSKVINIDEDGKLVTFDIVNDIKEGIVLFSKTDISSGEILEGAKIEIVGVSDTNNHIKIEFISSKNGNKFRLPIGKYQIREIVAPNGYILSNEVGKFEIKEDGEIVRAELKNKKIEKVVVDKTDNPKTGDKDILIPIIFGIGALVLLIGINIYNRTQYEYYYEYEDEEYEDEE